MKKFGILLLILLIAPIVGGLYGILHDQLTYTISQEYYTKFKFIQFGLEDWGLGRNIGTIDEPEIRLRSPRLGAAIVGLLATWWFGLFVGIVLGCFGLIHSTAKQMWTVSLKAFALTISIALIVGFIGLAYGNFVLTDNPPHWFYPDNLLQKSHFIIVGSMHNFSYSGGLIGLVAGVIFTIFQKRKYRKQLQRSKTSY